MNARPRRPTVAAPLRKLAVLRAEKPTLSFYRYLYETIGRPWLWTDRRDMSDDALAALIHDDKIEIYVLYVAGVPAGFTELDFRGETRVEITHLGLVPEFTGQGLGRFLLNWSVDAAWRQETRVVAVETDTADNPRALGMYQRAGFNVVGRAELERTPRSALANQPSPSQDL